MNDGTVTRTCGQDAACDIVLDDQTISPLHAHIELAADGLICVRDAGSDAGTFLNRNDTWIRIGKITLCIGDRVRFGSIEVPLERLTAVFGQASNARLEARHFAMSPGNDAARAFAARARNEPVLQKPRRNPVTGKIEDNDTDRGF